MITNQATRHAALLSPCGYAIDRSKWHARNGRTPLSICMIPPDQPEMRRKVSRRDMHSGQRP